jgi:CDP-paratose 2-epimerase
MSADGGIPKPFISGIRPILVTGGAGFIGCNLADRLAGDGHHVLVYDALTRPGVEGNLAWLRRRHPQRIAAIIADVRDKDALTGAASQAKAVFHYAAQVAVTTSLADPLSDFEINARGTLLILEALRRQPDPAPLIFASTNKVYGNLADVELASDGRRYFPRDPDLREYGIGESQRLDFHTPYGCSKGAAEQYVLDWARSYRVPTVVLRMSCIYGPRQLGTEDQGWVAHFIRKAIARDLITIYGDGRQVRDILNVRDAVAAYLAAWQRIRHVAGRAFNLGGGPRNAVSLLEIIGEIERRLGHHVALRFDAWRSGDQRYFVTDTRSAAAALGLAPPIGWRRGIAELTEWLQGRQRDDAMTTVAANRDAVMPAELAS